MSKSFSKTSKKTYAYLRLKAKYNVKKVSKFNTTKTHAPPMIG